MKLPLSLKIVLSFALASVFFLGFVGRSSRESSTLGVTLVRLFLYRFWFNSGVRCFDLCHFFSRLRAGLIIIGLRWGYVPYFHPFLAFSSDF